MNHISFQTNSWQMTEGEMLKNCIICKLIVYASNEMVYMRFGPVFANGHYHRFGTRKHALRFLNKFVHLPYDD